MDTVPGQEQDWEAFEPTVRAGKLYGRGSCDMKGPIAATLIAAASVDVAKLKKPLYIILTADEEVGLLGAKRMADTSVMLAEAGIEHGVIAEPTKMIPVYSHKGYCMIEATATGLAAHSSTGLGSSALLKVAPFLNYLAELDQQLQSDPSFQNDDYTPTQQTLNLVVDSGEAALNVTAPKTVVKVATRPMPNSRSREVGQMIYDKAVAYGLDATLAFVEPLVASLSAELVKLSVELTGKQPETVSYGTDGNYLKTAIQNLVILGPGDIALAHTVGEFVPVAQLDEAVAVYKELIERLCMRE